MRRLPLLSIIICFCFLFFSCSHSDNDSHNHEHEGHDHSSEEPHGHDDHDHEGHAAGEIVIEPEKAKEAGIIVQQVNPDSFVEVITTSGRILNSAADEATVVATQPGIISLVRPWTVGMAVSAGSPLFHVSQKELPEGDLATRAKIDLETTRKEYERIKKLYDEQLSTAQEFYTAQNAYENARLTVQALSNGGGGSISSPKGGYVIACQVKDGDYVDVGTPLMKISANRRMRLQADLPIRDFGKISEITSANFRLPQNETLYRLQSLNGRIVSHSRIAEGNSAYVPVIFEFDNAPGIVAGSFAEIYLLGNPRPGVIRVPKTALTEEQGIFYVYTQEDAECYKKREVKKGATDGSCVEIVAGLNGGEKIVTQGAMAVKLASMSTAIPGHTHEH